MSHASNGAGAHHSVPEQGEDNSGGGLGSMSRRSLIMIKMNGELQKADEYNAVDVLNPHFDVLSPHNFPQGSRMDYDESES
jgi:hypothetical protein